MGATVTIDTGGLTAFALRLRTLVDSFPVEEKIFLESCANVVRDEAKRNASSSAKTQPTIRTIPLPPIDGRQAVAVGAGSSGSGNAGLLPLLLEGGNGEKKFTHWEHPVFNNTSFLVAQVAKPYLEPALRGKEEELEIIADEAIEQQLEMELSGTFSGS